MDKDRFRSMLRSMAVRSRIRQSQLQVTTTVEPICYSIIGMSDVTVKDVAQYDKNLANLLDKVNKPIRELDAYILLRLDGDLENVSNL